MIIHITLAISFVLAASTSATSATAFGLTLGERIPEQHLAREGTTNAWILRNVPAPFEGFDGYLAKVDDTGTLCEVSAFAVDVEPGFAESLNRRVRFALSDIMGEPRHTNLASGNNSANATDRWRWREASRDFTLLRILVPDGFNRTVVFQVSARPKPTSC